MARVRVKASSKSGNVVSTQEVSPDDISSRITSIREIFPRSVQQQAEKFSISYVGPWNEWQDIIDMFASIDGVQSVFEIDAYRGQYMCPTVQLSVNTGMEGKVVQDIKSYYEGFHILKDKDGTVLVGFDAGSYLFDSQRF